MPRNNQKLAVVHPVIVIIAPLHRCIVASSSVTETDYESNFFRAQFVHFLLSPATVTFAVPLHRQWQETGKLWLPLSLTLIGCVTIAGRVCPLIP